LPTITLTLTDDQVVELIEQLPPNQQSLVYQRLAKKKWGRWIEASQGTDDEARRLAQARGLDWDTLNEDERMQLANELVHEERGR